MLQSSLRRVQFSAHVSSCGCWFGVLSFNLRCSCNNIMMTAGTGGSITVCVNVT